LLFRRSVRAFLQAGAQIWFQNPEAEFGSRFWEKGGRRVFGVKILKPAFPNSATSRLQGLQAEVGDFLWKKAGLRAFGFKILKPAFPEFGHQPASGS
jgi:hypothetical protein